MPLINYKVELTFKWTKYCILAAAGNYNTDANPNNFISQLKTQNYMFLSLLNQQETTKNYPNFLARNLKHQCIGMNIKQKVRIKIRSNSIDIFWNKTL